MSFNRFKKVAAVASVGAFAVTAFGMTAASASDVCPGGKVCLFAKRDFQDRMGYRSPGRDVMNVTGSNNDEMDSWKNLSNTWAAWYKHANGEGYCRDMAKRTQNDGVGWWDYNELSSWRTNHGCRG